MPIFTCEYCEKEVEKPQKEVNRSRRLGRRLFCNTSCAAKFSNAPKRAPTIDKVCPVCSVVFSTTTKVRASTFCSRECASAGSVTEYRRNTARQSGLAMRSNLISSAEALKIREAPHYVLLLEHLTKTGRVFEFEFPLGPYVFDVALLDVKTLIEFDGYYHQNGKQQAADREKEKYAQSQGYVVVRRQQKEEIFSIESLAGL